MAGMILRRRGPLPHPRGSDGADVAALNRTEGEPDRASRGQIRFSAEVDESVRRAIRALWVRRLDGFHRRDLHAYLDNHTPTTRYVKDGRSYRFATFRRLCRVGLWPVRLLDVAGWRLSADVLDPAATVEHGRCVTHGCLVVTLGGRCLRQGRLTMSARLEDGRWTWEEAVVETLPRRAWAYRQEKGPERRR